MPTYCLHRSVLQPPSQAGLGRALDVLAQSRASDLADRALLATGASLERFGKLGVYAHLHARGGAGCAEGRSPNRNLRGLAEVIAAFGLVGERLDVLVGENLTAGCRELGHLRSSRSEEHTSDIQSLSTL